MKHECGGPAAESDLGLICPQQSGPSLVRVSALIIPGWEERNGMKASKFSDAQKAFILKQGTTGFL